LTIGPCRDDDLDAAAAGEIWGTYLALLHWRRGIGRQVCRRAEAMLRERGVRKVVLWVLKGNGVGQRFYEAMGYAPDGASRTIEIGGESLPIVRFARELIAP